jgi:hypothetical protein
VEGNVIRRAKWAVINWLDDQLQTLITKRILSYHHRLVADGFIPDLQPPYSSAAEKMTDKATKEKVHYRKAKPGADRRCGNCWMFRPKNYVCIAVYGLIDKNDVCDWHEFETERKK